MKKILSFLLAAALLSGCVMTGCKKSESSSKKDEKKIAASTDKYRNFYQIFMYSFADSNGDHVGDFNGITEQLDYLNDGDPNGGNDLGIDGLWLTPITPSESYHKYSVEDYYNVDPSFGTLDDFDKMLEECHKRGISVIIDLVLNHISYKNPLFLSACDEVRQGKLDGDAEYFEFHEPSYYTPSTKVIQVGDFVCEANFSETMPEWNLTSQKTRDEFTKIAKFWLDRGVDGFRLDAVKYFENKHTDGVEFLKWFTDTCRGIKSDVYLVGEEWADTADIETLYASGIDSLFAFRFAESSGEIVQSVSTSNGQSLAKKLVNYDKKMTAANPGYINAMFLSNHDQVRIANSLESRGLAAQKFAANVYLLTPGNSFTYYGEELGMRAEKTDDPTDKDRYYRQAMVFDSDNPQDITVNGFKTTQMPTGGGVKQQLEDKNSLLNHYRKLYTAKLQNPSLARGRATEQQSFDDKAVCAFYVEKDGEKLLVIHNFSEKEAKTLEITDEMLKNAEIAISVPTSDDGDKIVLSDGKLTLPAYSSVVLRSAA